MKSPDAMTREELIEEVAYLRSELRPTLDHDRDKIITALRTTVAETLILSALYASRGHPVSNWRLAEAAPAGRMTADRNDMAAIKVWISRIRRKLGADAVLTIRGLGYALTPVGAAQVEAALSTERADA
jgi:DNA-binding response OmpR family regulator